MEDVGPDLGAEVDPHLLPSEVFDPLLSLTAHPLGQSGLQDAHGDRPVLHLRSFVLAGSGDAGGEVGDPDRRVGHVDVLAPRAGGAVRVDPKVLGVDVHVGVFLVQERDHVQAGEGRVAAVRLIVGRQPDQSVDPSLG